MRPRTTKHDGQVCAVVGGQYGSEGKGTIVAHLANSYDIHVRTGGPNAGHSFVHKGKLYKQQMLPCGWINPEAVLILGRGALIDPHQLEKEIELVEGDGYSIRDRLMVDADAMVIGDRHRGIEGGTEGEIHKRIGSTGEGVGAARVDRVNRDPSKIKRVRELVEEFPFLNSICFDDTPYHLRNSIINRGQHVLLEGTQGSGLSLIHGPWPYVTSNDTNAAQLAADAGIAPQLITDVVLVVRSHPIRVAGNSGPLKNEITWDDLSRKLGKTIVEKTTVTHKVRRVGEWDPDLVANAITLNDPTCIALTFADYINPEDEAVSSYNDLSRETRAFINYLENWYSVPVQYVGTGGPSFTIIDRGGDYASR